MSETTTMPKTPLDLALARDLSTVEAVEQFVQDCLDVLGGGFHPDTRGAEYRTMRPGGDGRVNASMAEGPTFRPAAAAEAFDANMAAAILTLDRAGTEDIYELTMRVAGGAEEELFVCHALREDDICGQPVRVTVTRTFALDADGGLVGRDFTAIAYECEAGHGTMPHDEVLTQLQQTAIARKVAREDYE